LSKHYRQIKEYGIIEKCHVKYCENKIYAKGYCIKHYYQIKRKGKLIN